MHNKRSFLCSQQVMSEILNGQRTDFVRPFDPIGETGDYLWCREVWAPVDELIDGVKREESTVIAYKVDKKILRFEGGVVQPVDTFELNWDMVKWQISISMPIWACRCWLLVTGVTAENINGEMLWRCQFERVDGVK